jgi:hypothetical protein
MRAEFLNEADRAHAGVEALQAALDAWVEQYNTVRPHQALGMRPPVDRFGLAAPQPTPAVACQTVNAASSPQATLRAHRLPVPALSC